MQRIHLLLLLSCVLAAAVADRIMYPSNSRRPSMTSTGTQTASDLHNGLDLKIPLTPSDKKQTFYIKCTVSTVQVPKCVYIGTTLQ